MPDTLPPGSAAPLATLLAGIADSPPLDQLLEQVLDAACSCVHADTGVVGLYDAAADTMRTAAARTAVPVEVEPSLGREEGLAGHILATGETVHCRYGELPRPRARALLEHTVIGLPLRVRQTLLGYLAVSLAPPRTFRAAQEEMLVLIAQTAAIAVDQVRARERERRTAKRFELIARIAADISQEPNLDALLQRTADAIHEVLQFPNVDIPLIDPLDPGWLVLDVRGGSYKYRITHQDRLPLERGIMGAAARERVTQLVNDVSADPRYVCPPGVTPARAELAVPICLGSEVLGVLNVESDDVFDMLDRDSLEIVADYLAVALRNASLFEQARDAAVLAERQRLARELHDNIVQILSSMSMLSQTLGSAWQRSAEDGERRAARLHQLAQTAFAEMRMLLRQLAPSEAEDAGISRKSRSLVGLEVLREQALPGALTRLLASIVPDNVAVKSNFSGYVMQRLEHEEAFYRVCQEAVSNTLRHADARTLRVEAAVNGTQAVLRIVDDGGGLGTEFRPGVGLGSMRARIETLHGVFRIGANNPRGTLIEARLPRADRAAAAPP